jgi:Uncharacterized conserved domain (SAYSvFN)
MPPARFRRSRALWENCHSIYHDENNGTAFDLRQQYGDTLRRYLRAILYEIQPIRYSICVTNFSGGYHYLIDVGSGAIIWGRKWIPNTCNLIINCVGQLTWEQWKWIAAIAIYYVFLRWIHAALDAGPVVIIFTALTVIFTVGLSDQTDKNGLSAYSVFNKGFQKILGSVDADALLQQHLGGGGIMQMLQPRQMDDDFDVDDEGPRRRRIQENVQLGNNNDGANPVQQPDGNDMNQNRPRRTGKKSRRDRTAIVQRREIRAQRDAALALGFGHNNDDDPLPEILDFQDVAG